jgi:hypothetical protein
MIETKSQKQFYLKIPYEILNLPGLDLCEKVLLAHIYSFGAKGCWQSNETLGAILHVSGRTIQRWLNNITRFVWVKAPKGCNRTVWAKSHPQVKELAAKYRTKLSSEPRQDCRTTTTELSHYRDKTDVVPTTKCVGKPRQNCHTTIINTITETKNQTIASPPPLPAWGQAPATLQVRRRQFTQEIERLKSGFGKVKREARLSPEQFEQRRQRVLKGLTIVGVQAGPSSGPGPPG